MISKEEVRKLGDSEIAAEIEIDRGVAIDYSPIPVLELDKQRTRRIGQSEIGCTDLESGIAMDRSGKGTLGTTADAGIVEKPDIRSARDIGDIGSCNRNVVRNIEVE